MSAKKKYFTINCIHLVHNACQILSTFTNQCHYLHLNSVFIFLTLTPYISILFTAIPQYTIISLIHWPPINPTHRLYLRVTWTSIPWVTWQAVTGVEGTHCSSVLRQTLANRALVYLSQGGRYRTESCMALG